MENKKGPVIKPVTRKDLDLARHLLNRHHKTVLNYRSKDLDGVDDILLRLYNQIKW